MAEWKLWFAQGLTPDLSNRKIYGRRPRLGFYGSTIYSFGYRTTFEHLGYHYRPIFG